jgi:hypothetical protein
MTYAQKNKIPESSNLISGLKDFGLNPKEWEVYGLEASTNNDRTCFLIRSKYDINFQILGWVKETASSLQWDHLSLFSI